MLAPFLKSYLILQPYIKQINRMANNLWNSLLEFGSMVTVHDGNL